MMSISSKLLAKAREFCSHPGAVVDERLSLLILQGAFASAADQSDWLGLQSEPPAPFTSVVIRNDAGELTEADEFVDGRRYTISIGKPLAEGVRFFVFEEGAITSLAEADQPRQILIAGLAGTAAFSTRGFDVVPWDLDTNVTVPPARTLISPAKLVSDYVPSREIAQDLAPWILITAPPAPDSKLYRAWQATAARRLLSGIVSSAVLEGDNVLFQASGPPVYRIAANDPSIISSWEAITDAATWVYLAGQDVEARHRLFSSELARADRPGQPFLDTLKQAREAADVAYAAHVQSSSRETLKALGDLRKTVIEETQKVSQRAQDLTTALWKDVAASTAPFILKLIPDASKIASNMIAACFFFVAAAFISVSFGMQLRINRTFFDSQQASRDRWFRTLYIYISQQERNEIAEQPIQMALKNYEDTRKVLLVIYGFMVAVLLGFGWHYLHAPPPPESPPAGAAAAAQPSLPAASQATQPAAPAVQPPITSVSTAITTEAHNPEILGDMPPPVRPALKSTHRGKAAAPCSCTPSTPKASQVGVSDAPNPMSR